MFDHYSNVQFMITLFKEALFEKLIVFIFSANNQDLTATPVRICRRQKQQKINWWKCITIAACSEGKHLYTELQMGLLVELPDIGDHML